MIAPRKHDRCSFWTLPGHTRGVAIALFGFTFSSCIPDHPVDVDDVRPDLEVAQPDQAMSVDPADLATLPPPPDLAIIPAKPCSWRDRFSEAFGRAFSRSDVAFVTTDGKVTRGMDQLDFAAQKSQIPDIVKVKGNTNRIQEIQLLDPATGKVQVSSKGAYIYGLGYAMWLEVNAYGESGITEMTLIRQFGGELPSYQQLVGLYRVLTKNAEAQVPAADRTDFQQAAAKLMTAIESGALTFALGSGHAADFPATAQSVNGKTFSFQLSNGYGMDPQLGFQRNGVWGPLWQTYSPGGNWSASAPGMQPKCGGCSTDSFAGTKYLFCEGPVVRKDAQRDCGSHGGYLATVDGVFINSFLRGMAPNAGKAFVGLDDLAELGKYVWATGKAATYTNWGPGQPDHWMNQERCVQLYDGKAITQWNDIDCASQLPYLCQLP